MIKIIRLMTIGFLSLGFFVSAYAIKISNHANQSVRIKLFDDTGYKNYAMLEQILMPGNSVDQVNFKVSDDVVFVHVDHDYAPSRMNVELAQSGTANYGHIRHLNNSGCVIDVKTVSENGTYSADIGPGC